MLVVPRPGLSVRRGFGGHHISYFIFQNHISKKKKKTRVYGQKPIPSFRPRTLAGHLPSYVDMSGKFSGKCRAYTHQNGSGHIHGGDRYLKNGIKSRVQNLSIAVRYDQKFASGVPLPVGKSQKPKLKSGSRDYAAPPKMKKYVWIFNTYNSKQKQFALWLRRAVKVRRTGEIISHGTGEATVRNIS